LSTAIQKNAYEIQVLTCILHLPSEQHVLLSQKSATELQKFLEKKLAHPHVEVLLRAAPEKYPELRTLQNAVERWQRLTEANPVLTSFLQLLKGQILPQDITYEAIPQKEQEHTPPS
jgi:hypothetical protein